MFLVFDEVNEGSGLFFILMVRESFALEEKDFLSDLSDVMFVMEDDFSRALFLLFFRIVLSRIHASGSLSILQSSDLSNSPDSNKLLFFFLLNKKIGYFSFPTLTFFLQLSSTSL